MGYRHIILGSALAFGMFTSCTSNTTEANSCEVLGVSVDCEKSEVYNKMLAINEEINQTFEEGAEPLSLEEELALREKFVEHYKKNEKTIEGLYASIKDSLRATFPPEELLKMRTGEVEHFKKEMISREKTQALLESLSIDTFEKDTLLPGYDTKKRRLILQIRNTSDKTITSIEIEKNYKSGGKVHRASVPTYYIFTTDQIYPTPETAELAPGSKLTLTFETSEAQKAMPEIVSITTASE